MTKSGSKPSTGETVSVVVKPLTEQQQKFAERLAVHGDPRLAATEAGYQSSRIAWQLIRHPGIQEAIQRALDRDPSILNAGEILRELSTIALDSEHAVTGRVRALELLGKRIGLWEAWIYRKGIPPQVMTGEELTLYDENKEKLALPGPAAED